MKKDYPAFKKSADHLVPSADEPGLQENVCSNQKIHWRLAQAEEHEESRQEWEIRIKDTKFQRCNLDSGAHIIQAPIQMLHQKPDTNHQEATRFSEQKAEAKHHDESVYIQLCQHDWKSGKSRRSLWDRAHGSDQRERTLWPGITPDTTLPIRDRE